jgi:hypothetical protein
MQKTKWILSSTESSNSYKSRKFSRDTKRIGAKRALLSASAITLLVAIGSPISGGSAQASVISTTLSQAVVVHSAATKASLGLSKLSIKGRAPKTGYDRSLFSDGWGNIGSCDLRNFVLARDLKSVTWRAGESCMVETGVLKDPYTGKTINFKRGVSTSLKVQIDHVVPVSDAWQKGAQKLTSQLRYNFYNDPLNLLAVDGPTNSSKSDSDAASWLPPNKSYRCAYVSRQIAVKLKYKLWVTSAEKDAMARVLTTCPSFLLPTK